MSSNPDPFPPDAAAVELAVGFIEADPTFAGAELMKQKLSVHLESTYLTSDQRNRLAAVLLRSLRHGTESVFRGYARLAPAVTSALFEAAVTCYAASCEYPVTDRAKHVLSVLHERGRQTAPRTRSIHPAGRCLLATRC